MIEAGEVVCVHILATMINRSRSQASQRILRYPHEEAFDGTEIRPAHRTCIPPYDRLSPRPEPIGHALSQYPANRPTSISCGALLVTNSAIVVSLALSYGGSVYPNDEIEKKEIKRNSPRCSSPLFAWPRRKVRGFASIHRYRSD